MKYFINNEVQQLIQHPFGMLMPGRRFTASTYRYGFNGKENDNNVKGEGNEQDYGMRIYDSRIGKFLSVDPLTKEYSDLTPYQFAGNTPIWAIDLDGLEPYYTNPQQIFYQGASDITQGLGRAWDKLTGFFIGFGSSEETELTKNTSIVVSHDKTLSFGGKMENWVQSGRNSSNNSMPKLRITDFFDVEYKEESKIELKTKFDIGFVKVEDKINLADGSTEVKGTIKVPSNKVTQVPLKVSGSVSTNNSTNTSKIKAEVKTDTKPISVGGSIEVQKDKSGNLNSKASLSVSYEKNTGKLKHTSTLTVGKKF